MISFPSSKLLVAVRGSAVCIIATLLIVSFSSAPMAQGRANDARNSPRIMFGSVVGFGQGPWAGSLQFQKELNNVDSFHHFCGGSFVSPVITPGQEVKIVSWRHDDPAPRWLVTAAHCVVNDDGSLLDANRMRVLGGAPNRSNPTQGEIQKVLKILPHLQFDPHTMHNDIALLWLEASAKPDIDRTRRASIRMPGVVDTSWINELYLVQVPIEKG